MALNRLRGYLLLLWVVVLALGVGVQTNCIKLFYQLLHMELFVSI